MMEKICGIYKITSPSRKIYIGQSTNINKRIKQYEKLRCKNQIRIYNSILKHGWNSHLVEIVIECEPSDLNRLEKYYIELFNTFNTQHGLNLTDGGDCAKLSEETKKRIGDANKGNTFCKGRICTKETRLKIGNANKGKTPKLGIPCSDETKEKISKSQIGKIISKEIREKISKTQMGRIISKETREKISKKK